MPKKHFYRNKIQIEEIEPESLWELIDNYFVLVDDDEFYVVLASENEEKFYEERN